MDTLQDLFEASLRDIFYAEKQIVKALPKMAKTASSSDLAAAFEQHPHQTEGQIARLEEIFRILGKAARSKKCLAIDGIIEEGEEVIKEAKDDTVRDHAGSRAIGGALRDCALRDNEGLG